MSTSAPHSPPQGLDHSSSRDGGGSEQLLRLTETRAGEFVLGGRTFGIVANPVFADDGTRLGTVLEWADRTEEVAVEKEVSPL